MNPTPTTAFRFGCLLAAAKAAKRGTYTYHNVRLTLTRIGTGWRMVATELETAWPTTRIAGVRRYAMQHYRYSWYNYGYLNQATRYYPRLNDYQKLLHHAARLLESVLAEKELNEMRLQVEIAFNNWQFTDAQHESIMADPHEDRFERMSIADCQWWLQWASEQIETQAKDTQHV
jgi:hypothetical protein